MHWFRHRSSRRAPPPKDSDYDHEITLADHSSASLPPKPSTKSQASEGPDAEPAGPSSSSAPERAASQGPSPPPPPPLERSSTSQQDRKKPQPIVQVQPETPLPDTPALQNGASRGSQRGRKRHSRPEAPESAIDILYENERGGFLCGVPLFSSRALGALDAPPWTNAAHKASPTDIHTAQVPDPSWEWAWPEWRINVDPEGHADEGGWEYSFMFSRRFSWHGPTWYNSFVRRRAWIRKRVKKRAGVAGAGGQPPTVDPHLLNPDYFTVQSAGAAAAERRASSSRPSSRIGSKASVSQFSMATGGTEDGGPEPEPDIADVETLMAVLRRARIDREKIEAVENFLAHGGEELAHLQDEMHEIMSLFVFQASRRALLSRLTEVYDEAVKQKEEEEEEEAKRKGDNGEGSEGEKNEESARLQRRLDSLSAAIKHADEEVRRLQYWSDVKAMAEGGGSAGAVDQRRGWDAKRWEGVDGSGPSQPPPPPRAAAVPKKGEGEGEEKGEGKEKEGKEEEKDTHS